MFSAQVAMQIELELVYTKLKQRARKNPPPSRAQNKQHQISALTRNQNGFGLRTVIMTSWPKDTTKNCLQAVTSKNCKFNLWSQNNAIIGIYCRLRSWYSKISIPLPSVFFQFLNPYLYCPFHTLGMLVLRCEYCRFNIVAFEVEITTFNIPLPVAIWGVKCSTG